MRNYFAALCCRVGRWLFVFGSALVRRKSALTMPPGEYVKYLKAVHDLPNTMHRVEKPIGDAISPEDRKYPDTVAGREHARRAHTNEYRKSIGLKAI